VEKLKMKAIRKEYRIRVGKKLNQRIDNTRADIKGWEIIKETSYEASCEGIIGI